MIGRTIARRAPSAGALALLVLVVGCGSGEPDSAAVGSATATAASADAHEGLLYGRVTTDGGVVYEGRLRWGGDEEALWASYFNGVRDENPWVAYAPLERRSVGVFGVEIARWQGEVDGERPFMARYGDITRIERSLRDIQVRLKSGTVFVLDRLSSDDLADGIRVWDGESGVVDLVEGQIRTIELLPVPRSGEASRPLHGTVRTPSGDFTGLVEWNREGFIGTDRLEGLVAGNVVSLPFDTIRAITRVADDGSSVTLLDGSEVTLSGTRSVGRGNRGLYVDDGRYGRVLIPWEVFERVDFSPGGTGPAYGEFAAGRALTGHVLTRSGRRLAGRLVYDLDESETSETLDAPSQGITYTIPFGLVASIALTPAGGADAGHARVTLQGGEELRLERSGDLGDQNAGILVFADGGGGPDYVPWADVARIELDPD